MRHLRRKRPDYADGGSRLWRGSRPEIAAGQPAFSGRQHLWLRRPQLEIHEITFLYALFIVYYVFYADRRTPRQRRRNRVLICLSIMKRIMLPALAVSLLYVWLVRKPSHPGRAAIATGIVWFLFYLYAVYTGQLAALLNRLGINTMGREYIWQLTRSYYTLSPTYLGRAAVHRSAGFLVQTLWRRGGAAVYGADEPHHHYLPDG